MIDPDGLLRHAEQLADTGEAARRTRISSVASAPRTMRSVARIVAIVECAGCAGEVVVTMGAYPHTGRLERDGIARSAEGHELPERVRVAG